MAEGLTFLTYLIKVMNSIYEDLPSFPNESLKHFLLIPSPWRLGFHTYHTEVGTIIHVLAVAPPAPILLAVHMCSSLHILANTWGCLAFNKLYPELHITDIYLCATYDQQIELELALYFPDDW